MIGEKIFIDTNIIIYAHSQQDFVKQRIAREIILANDFMISTHVIDEFYNICSKKLKFTISETNQNVNFLLDNYPVVPIYGYTDKTAIFLQEK
jgi:predicted nucleic acid-binding protein